MDRSACSCSNIGNKSSQVGSYLKHQCDKTNSYHKAKRATFPFSHANNSTPSAGCFQILEPKFSVKPSLVARYKQLANALSDSEEFKPLCVNVFAPVEPWRKYEYLKALTTFLCCDVYSYFSTSEHDILMESSNINFCQ